MELSEVTVVAKVFLIDCLAECAGCGGDRSIEVRLDPDMERAEGYCIKCGKHWTVAEKDLQIFQKLIESEEGQKERDVMLITKHILFDTIGVKPYPFKYEDERIACQVVLDKFASAVKEVSENHEIIAPHMPLIHPFFNRITEELEKDEPSFEPIRKMMTDVVNAHIEATQCLASLDGSKSDRDEFLEEKVNEITSA